MVHGLGKALADGVRLCNQSLKSRKSAWSSAGGPDVTRSRNPMVPTQGTLICLF